MDYLLVEVVTSAVVMGIMVLVAILVTAVVVVVVLVWVSVLVVVRVAIIYDSIQCHCCSAVCWKKSRREKETDWEESKQICLGYLRMRNIVGERQAMDPNHRYIGN